MANNATKTDIGVEVYESEIYRLCDEYIDSLNNPEDIKNRITFSGMLRYIYNNLFKPKSTDTVYNRRSSILDYGDIDLLENVYDIFLSICCKYQKEYTANSFLTMIGLSRTTFNDWKNGRNIPNSNRFSEAVQKNGVMPKDRWSNFVKKVTENSEQALSESMLGGNLMAYAQLKCWHGWKEEPQQVLQVGNAPHKTREEIALEFANAQRPELPDFD